MCERKMKRKDSGKIYLKKKANTKGKKFRQKDVRSNYWGMMAGGDITDRQIGGHR
jgi:hypothetical protein